MNNTYRLIWNSAKETWVVVAEIIKNRGSLPSFVVGSAMLLAAVLSGALPASALDPSALPTGGQITVGSGSISQSGSSMTVTQASQRMVADWASFNIGQNASVAFQQPGASSVALNRIADQNPTQILGSLSANGQIFLLNPSGIIFGQTAQVNVGALVASSLNITNDNFMAGKLAFEKAGTVGAIINQGSIRTADGGYVAFLAPQIKNEGTIIANQGSVVLAAADKVNLDFAGDGLLSYSVEQGAVDALAENKGLIKADGGLVVLTAKAADSLTQAVVNNEGMVEAASMVSTGGRIILDADGGMTTVSGTLDASSTGGHGGSVIATGNRVWVKDGAHLTASGATGGGQVLIGGSWQNSDTSVRQATGTVVEQGALLEANATDTGNGGTVVAWSDITNSLSVTRAYGTFEAKGGVNGGGGGRIETSGHWLDVAGSQGGASAAKGTAGIWLFDPYNVTITGADANGSWTGANPDVFSPTNTGSTINAATIVGKLQGGTSVTVTTNGGGGEIGDITVSSAITKASGDTDVTLTLQAANSIVVDQAISNTGGTGKLNVVLDADNNSGTGDGAGIVLLNNNITTNGGSLSFGTGRTATIGGVSTLVGGDVFVGGAGAITLSTNGGSVDVKGEMIVANTNGLTINSANGNIRFYGLLNSGNQYAFVDKTGSAGFGSWAEARTEAINGTGGASAVNDSYLVNITSRLENSVAVSTAGYKGSWIGAYRPNLASYNWAWADGPEAGVHFFTQTAGGGGSPTTGYYANFGPGEPNGALVAGGESCGQFFGTAGQWNDLPNSEVYKATQINQYAILGFVRETNLAASPLTISAGAGTVTFSGAVGISKALASLNVTSSSGIAINGGAVTTEGLQTYTGNVTLGSASTTLAQTNANSDFTVQSAKTITNAYGADASLTIKTTGSILMNSGSSISSSTGKLNTVLWSDSDNSGSGYILVHDGNTISTNGGNIVMAGGLDDGANGGTVGDDIPDGYAVSTVTTSSGISIGRNNNAATSTTTINSGGGNILMRGKSTGGSPSMGIHYAYGGTLNAGSGTLTMLGEATNYAGIELSAWLDGAGASYLDITAGTVDIRGITSSAGHHGLASSQLNNEYTRITAGAGGIYLYGHNTANTAKGVEISLNATTTDGGNIMVESPNYVAIYGGANAHSFNAGTGNTTLKTNTLSIGANHTLAGSGTLAIEPYAAGTTIGIAGGAGTLSLPASYFSTNFTNGFSGITVGSATAGLVSVGGSALSYNDPLTLKTGNSIFFSTTSAVTGNNNALTLWTRAGGNDAANDGIDGSVWMPVGSSVNTGGGNITIGGGTNPTTGYTLGDNDATSSENNARYRGASINGTLNANGGNISILGRGNPSGANARGVSIGGAISTTGAGTITITGVAKDASDGVALGDSSVGGTTGTLASVNGNIVLNGSKDTGNNGINLSTAGSGITISGTGNLVMNASGNINGTGTVAIGGTTSLTAGTANISLANTSNNFTGAVTVVSGANVSIVDSNAMTLGAVTSTGTVDVATLTGNLTLTGAVATTNATATAIKLNAGKNAAAGTAAGGDILVAGGSASTGAGGYANLYSGSVSGSTGLTALVGSGSGRFRYNSDETAANYTTALTAGTNAIYREHPAVTTTANDDNKTYSGVPYSGGNGVTYAGFQNGDTSASLGGALTYGGTSQGAVNAGSYTIVPSGYTNGLGYALAYANGTLTSTGAPQPPAPQEPPQSILASITSPQRHQNGTQDSRDTQESSGNDSTVTYMGPGAGSGQIETSRMGGLLIDRTGYRSEEEVQEQL